MVRKILVTGADGFIGSHLVEHLVRQGSEVRAFVLYNSFNSWGWLDQAPREILDSIDVFAGDVRDPHSVRQAVRDCGVVIHLAALVGIPYSYRSPSSYLETNVTGTLNVVQAATDLGVEKVVHTSTSEVYGTARFVPITEDHPLHAQSPYAASKLAADQVALSFHRSFDTPVAVVRPFNTYGPRQSARAVIPTIITQIAGGNGRLKLGALHPTRDFSHVADTVRGIVAVTECEGAVGEVINLGSDYEISIADTVDLIAEIMGAEARIELDPARLRPPGSEVERLWADTAKARALLDWKRTYGGVEGLKRGLEETVKWFTDRQNLRHYKIGMYNI